MPDRKVGAHYVSELVSLPRGRVFPLGVRDEVISAEYDTETGYAYLIVLRYVGNLENPFDGCQCEDCEAARNDES